jgi:hypothetical protein
MKNLFFLAFCMISSAMVAQPAAPSLTLSASEAKAVQDWMKNIYEVGVIAANDTFTITAEARRVAVDSQWRKIIYPATYRWTDAQYLLKNLHIKTGLWYLINLYAENEANREAVLKYLVSLDDILDMQQALTASFYTYIFFDPAAGSIVNGKPVIQRPDILDTKLHAVREMTREVVKRR